MPTVVPGMLLKKLVCPDTGEGCTRRCHLTEPQLCTRKASGIVSPATPLRTFPRDTDKAVWIDVLVT